MTRVAVVTGSSSGIEYETSLLLARNQITTYATMRNVIIRHSQAQCTATSFPFELNPGEEVTVA